METPNQNHTSTRRELDTTSTNSNHTTTDNHNTAWCQHTHRNQKKKIHFFKDLKGLIKGLFKGDKDKGKGKGKGYVQYVPVHQQPHYQTYTPQYQTQSYYHTDSYDYE